MTDGQPCSVGDHRAMMARHWMPQNIHDAHGIASCNWVGDASCGARRTATATTSMRLGSGRLVIIGSRRRSCRRRPCGSHRHPSASARHRARTRAVFAVASFCEAASSSLSTVRKPAHPARRIRPQHKPAMRANRMASWVAILISIRRACCMHRGGFASPMGQSSSFNAFVRQSSMSCWVMVA